MIETGDPRWCACGCAAEAHQHYRPGTDCGACGEAVCPSFAPGTPLPASAGLRRALLVALGAPSALVLLIAAGMFAGSWAVYTLLTVALLLGIFLLTGRDGRPS